MGMQTRKMARTGRIALELCTGDLPASPPVEDLANHARYLANRYHFCADTHKWKISVMTEEKQKWHSYYLYPEGKIMPSDSGGERIFMKKMMLTISLCSRNT